MYLNKTRGHNKRIRPLSGFLTDNAVLTLGLALPFAISATYTVQGAAMIIAGMFTCTLPVLLLASLVGRHLPAWSRVPIYALCAMLLLIPLESVLTKNFPVVMDSLGVYFPIIAVNTLLFYRCEKKALHTSPPLALLDGLLQLLGFTAVMLASAALRELFGNGTLGGAPVKWVSFKLGGLLVPFGGCILLAFMAAFSKYAGRLMRAALYRSDLKKEALRSREAKSAVTEPLFAPNEELPPAFQDPDVRPPQ